MTDGRTDQPTDRPTDRPTTRLQELLRTAKNISTDSERSTPRLHVVARIALTFNSFSLLNPVLNMWCVIFKQFFMKLGDKGFMFETIH